MQLAQLVLKHRLLPQDPLEPADEPPWLPALLEPERADASRIGVADVALI
jgi:hypothetical protein